jgi:hypothetical protein
MRFIKKLALYTKNPIDDRFSVLADDRIVTDSKVSLQVPVGAKTDRIISQKYLNGAIRYNTDLQEFEVYNQTNLTATSPNISGGWEILRTIRQASITAQNLGYGNYNDIYFGPLKYAVDVNLPQNLLVFIDGVYQTPTTNYTLDRNPVSSTATLVVSAPRGTSTLYLSTLTNIDLGAPGTWRTISTSLGFRPNTTLTNVSTVYDYFQDGWPVTISNTTTTALNSGTRITIEYSTGTYIKFTGVVPAKPVMVLLGFDGYFPAGSDRTLFES